MLKRALALMESVFPKSVLIQGRTCFDRGHVLTVRLSDGLLKARVMGESLHIHDVFLDFKVWPQVPSQCNCPQGKNCHHAVACLYQLNQGDPVERVPAFHDRFKTLRQADNALHVTHAVDQVLRVDDVTWYSESEEGTGGNHFFSYQLGIMIDDKPVLIVPWLITFLNRFDVAVVDHWKDDELIQLPIGDGKVLEVMWGRIRPLIHLLIQCNANKQLSSASQLMLTHYQLVLMREAEESIAPQNQRWQGTAELKIMLNRLMSASLSVQDIPIPQGLTTVLRDYQYAGFCWLNLLRMSQFGGVLADDMGLGKTVQTLALLQGEKEAGRMKRTTLIVAPTSVLGNWFAESERFTPQLKVLICHGADRSRWNFSDYDVVISTYGMILRDKRRFLDHKFYYLILDEAQFIKNTQTKTREIIQQIQAVHRLCLTGTPLENHLGELWSLFHFLTPGLLGDKKQFRRYFRHPIEKNQDKERQVMLVKRIQPFLLRRTKNQVARELPYKTEMTQLIELTGAQRDLYEVIRMSTEKEVRAAIAKQGLGRSHLILLDALLKLRQVCCDPRLLKWPDELITQANSAKLDACMELLDNLMDEGRSVLVFSQFTSMLSLIESQLITRNYRYLKLTGKTQARQKLVERFQMGEAPIFLISLKAGGVGLNLTQADTVIHYDPWWNPAVEDQATDRSHRIGQQKPVFVYRLIASGTVEEAMVAMQEQKRLLFSGVLSDQPMNLSVNLNELDIAKFFAPLG